MKLTHEQFKKYIEDNGVTDAKTTEDFRSIPKGTLIKFGLFDNYISSYEEHLKGQRRYRYNFDAQWLTNWRNVYKGLFEVEDDYREQKKGLQKELRISVKTQEEWNAVSKKIGYKGGKTNLFPVTIVIKDNKLTNIYYNYSFSNTISAQEYLGYDPNNSEEEVKVKYGVYNLGYTSDTDWDAVKKQLEQYEKNPSSSVQIDYVKGYTWFRFPDGTTEAYNRKLSKEEIKQVIDNKQRVKKYKYSMEFNQLTKPKGKKYMSIISNAFKSKENKALEHFGLGTTETLSERGRQEFVDFLWETLKEEKKAFLSKMVEAYKEDKE